MSQIDVVMTGDEAKLWRSFQKIVAGQKQVEDGYKKIGTKADATSKSVERTGQMGQKSFGGAALGALTSYAAGLGTVSAAVGMVTSAFHKLQEEQKKTLQMGEQKTVGNMQLNQVARSPEHLAELQKQRDSEAKKHGIAPGRVQQLIFDAVSNNFEKDVPKIMQASGAYSVESMSDIAGRSYFRRGGLDAMGAINLTAMAAKDSRLTFEQLAPSMVVGAEGAGRTASKPAELAAITSTLATDYASASTTGDRIKAFGALIGSAAEKGDQRFVGQDIMGSVDVIQSMKPADRAKFLGESQEIGGIYKNLVQAKEEIARREALYSKNDPSSPESEVKQAMDRAANNPEMKRQKELNQARIQNEISMEDHLAEGAYKSETAIQRGERKDREDGYGPMMRSYRGMIRRGVDTVSDSPAVIEGVTNAVGATYQVSGPGIVDSIMRRLDVSAANLEKSSKNLEIRSYSRADAQRAEAQGNRE